MTLDAWFTDHPPSERWPHYTRANAGEVLPTPASPLGQTFGFDKGILVGFQSGSVQTGFYELSEYRDDPPEMCGFFGGYFYINLANVRMQAVRNPAITVDQLDMAFFGDHPDVPAYSPHPDDEKPHLQPIADAHMNFVLTSTEWPQLMEDKRLVSELRSNRPDLTSLSDQALVDRAMAILPVLVELGGRHLIASSSSGIAPGMLSAVAAAIEDPSIPMRLLAGLGDVDSAAPSYAIWDMSRKIRASAALTEAFDAGVDGLVGRLAASGSGDGAEFLSEFVAFLAEFGSRGPNEWELSAQTWETDPTIALAAIERVRFQTDGQGPRERAGILATERESLVGEVRQKLADLGDDTLSGMFEGALVGGNMMVFRERGKTNVIKAVHEARVTFRELGQRHGNTGMLADASHIFMLTADELQAFVDVPADWAQTLADRAADWDELWQLEPPFFIKDGNVPPISTWARKGEATAEMVTVGEVIAGVAGSPGVVEGTARIVNDPTDPGDLGPGDIMVAPLTDPAWTPLFMAADGVVVNVGGQISHAIIVSRELGLPCVVSATDATVRIPDGATIRVDGSAGEVTIIALH
jgi:phosphohistidine swiveling domain-containing protein